jgi:hypothetical protein
MFMRTYAMAAAAAAAALFGATHSLAATVSTTDSFTGVAFMYDPATDYSPATGYSPPTHLGGYDGLLTLAGFNTALGTLNSVSVSETVKTSLEFTDAFAFGDSIHINASVNAGGQSPYGGAGFAEHYTFDIAGTTAGHTYDTGVQFMNEVSGVYTNNFPSTFGPFTSGVIYVPVLGYVVFGPSTGSFLTEPTSSYSYAMTFTYDYTPSAVTGGVPEPATWALMIGGFGLTGAVLRRRRTAVAV